jgi:hypothetical protein
MAMTDEELPNHRKMSKPEMDGIFMGICALCSMCADGRPAEPDDRSQEHLRSTRWTHYGAPCPAEKLWQLIGCHKVKKVPAPPILGNAIGVKTLARVFYEEIQNKTDMDQLEEAAYAFLAGVHHWTLLRRGNFDVWVAVNGPRKKN